MIIRNIIHVASLALLSILLLFTAHMGYEAPPEITSQYPRLASGIMWTGIIGIALLVIHVVTGPPDDVAGYQPIHDDLDDSNPPTEDGTTDDSKPFNAETISNFVKQTDLTEEQKDNLYYYITKWYVNLRGDA